MRSEQPSDLDGVVRPDPALDPVVRRDADAHRLSLGPHGPHGVEDFERIPQPVRERAPYSSSRRFVSGEMNADSRYPCAQCSSSRSNPALIPRRAAATNASWTASMSTRVIARGVGIVGTYGIGDGAIISQLSSSGTVSLPPAARRVRQGSASWEGVLAPTSPGTSPCGQSISVALQ